MKFYRIQALLLKYWYLSTRRIDRIFDIFYWPVLGLVVFGFTTLYITDVANFPEIIIFLLGGMILWSILQRIQQDVTVYLLEDFWSGNVANTFVTPLKESEIFVSVFIVGAIRAILSFFVMYVVAIIGYQFNIFQGGLSSLVFSIPLFLFAWGLGILISGLIFRYGMRIQVFAWSISVLLQPLAAAYYPLETLPPILQTLAKATPLVYIFEGFREAFKGTFLVNHFITALILAILSVIVGYWFFSRSIKASRKSGLLTKY